MVHKYLSSNHRDPYKYSSKMNITSHFQKFGGDSKLIKKTRPPVISTHTCTQTSMFRDTERVMLIFRWKNRFKTSGKYSVKYPRGQGIRR